MMEDIEKDGQWWTTDNPDNKVSGRLSFDIEDGAELELFDTFGDPDEFVPPDEKEPVGTILGLTKEKEHITLLNCGENWPTSGSSRTPSGHLSYQLDRYEPEYVLLGDHFEDSVNFDAVNLHFPYLDEWAEVNLIEGIQKENGGGFEYSLVNAERAEIGDLTLILGFTVNEEWGGQEARLEQETRLIIGSDTPLNLDETIERVITNIRRFFALAAFKPVQPTKVTGVLVNVDEYNLNREVQILYSPSNQQILESEWLPGQLRFTYSDIADEISEILEQWFTKADRLEPLYELYFGTIYNDS
jgi:hypothetical protein